MNRKLLAAMLVLSCLILMGCHRDKSAQTLADLNVGQRLFLYENDTAAAYLVAAEDYQGNALLLREELLPELHSLSEYHAQYENSALDCYLSTEFPNLFPEIIERNLASVQIQVTEDAALYTTGGETRRIMRKVFLLSFSEVGYGTHAMAAQEGEKLPLFSDDASRIAFRGDNPCSWWLRTPYTGFDSVTWAVGGDGVKTETASAMENGVRPAFCLPPEMPVTQTQINGMRVYIIKEGEIS